MALDPTTGGKPVKPKAKPVNTIGPRPEEGAAILPSEPPVPALQKHGVQVGISQVNEKVQRIHDSHVRSFGRKPSPGLVFDLLRNPDVDDYDELFRLPKSKREANAFRVSRSVPVEELDEEELSDKDVIERALVDFIAFRSTGAGYGTYVAPGKSDRLEAALQRNPKLARKYNEEIYKLAMYYNQPQVAGLGIGGESPDLIMRAGQQILGSLANSPYGIYTMGQAFATDVKNAAVKKPWEKPKEAQTAKLAEEMARQVVEDFRHPIRNIGYLTMDVFAILTGGAGMTGRVRAAKTAPKGEKLRALATRPVAGSYEMGWGDFTASVPLLENAAARVLQKHVAEKRNKKMVERQAEGWDGDKNNAIYDDVFSPERRLERERRINAEIEFAVATAPLINYLKMTQWSARAKSVIGEVMRHPSVIGSIGNVRKRERLGLEKAAQILLTDDPNPFRTWRQFHERQIAMARAQIREIKKDDVLDPNAKRRSIRSGEYTINAHVVQLEALALAKEIVENPSKRFQPFIDRTLEVSKGQQKIKREVLGLSDEIAMQALARKGAHLRGERMIDLGEGRVGLSGIDPDPVIERIKKAEDAISSIQKKIAVEKKTLNLHRPGDKDTQARAAIRLEATTRLDRFEKQLASRERALGRAQRELQSIIEKSTPLERLMTGKDGGRESGYLPDEREVHSKRKLGPISLPGGKKSRYGVKPPDKPDSLRYRNDFKSLDIGDFRFDTSHLLAEEFIATTRAAFATTQWNDLWSIGTKEITSPYSMPIRNVKTAPENLKKVVVAMEGNSMAKDAAVLLSDDSMKELREWLHPSIEEMNKMIEEGTARKSEFRFVDERFIFNSVGGVSIDWWKLADKIASGIMSPVNEPMRLLLIFLTPAYFLNAGGNALLSLFHQGFMAIPNGMRSAQAHKFFGDEGVSIIDALGGETLTSTLVSEQNRLTMLSQATMKFWQKVTDTLFRRSAVIHELRRRGVLKDDMTPEQAVAALKADENRPLLVEAARAARQSMLDFNRLSWPERAVARHMLFIYSFLRASTVYGGRYLIEHPLKHATLAQAGRDREEDLQEELGGIMLPEWFVKHGYFAGPLGIQDPVQFNVPQMLQEIVYTGQAMFGDAPYASPSSLTSPATKTITRLITGRDEQGRELEAGFLEGVPLLGGNFGKTFLSLANETPIGYALKREEREKQERPLPEPAIKSGYLDPVAAATAREHAALEHGTFEADSWDQTWGRLLARSAIPYQVEEAAADARAWRDLRDSDPEKYIQHQLDSVQKMVKRQAEVMGVEDAPQEVKDAVDLVSRIAIKIEEWRKDLRDGNDVKIKVPTHKQIALETVDILLEMGTIDKATAKRHREMVNAARSPKESLEARLSLLHTYGKAWKNWVDRVNKVMWFETAEYDVAVEDAAKEGIGSFKGSVGAKRATKWAYGRKFYEFGEEYDRRVQEIQQLSGKAATTAYAELRVWLEDNDKPVKIDGRVFPSPERMRYMKKTIDQRGDTQRSIMTGGWATATAFERELVGLKPSKNIMEGWRILRKAQDDNDDAGVEYARQVAEAIDKGVPGFLKDYLFSREPLAWRMKQFKQIRESAYASQWRTVLDAAHTLAKGMKDGGYKQEEIAEHWAEQGAPQVRDFVAKAPAGFRSEFNAFAQEVEDDGTVNPTDFVERLVS